MNFNKPKTHMIDFLFPLALFCVFSVSTFIVVIIGTNVYQSTVVNMNENYTTRTSLTYVKEKVRQGDINGKVTVGNIAGNSTLILEETFENVPYRTYIYGYNGSLKELFIKKDQPFSLGDGKAIMAVDNFTVSKVGSVLKLEITNAQGTPLEAFVYPQSVN